ncbi:NRDE family protein [Agarivorans sp. 1_MG-2023]|uniref:NRDE family protein n=1 Tax=Agarivorans sp. 1_MG-2023 TaxID=3062634 RepID=UPI0026E220AD|nr:NRDE family protein [Agarivorans sp. 1_MG-2023]MDO6763228.1 NRDE family protein [Agarivorans sp. 1_MG-2023]
MCTLSVLRLNERTLVTMNRDEARSRHEAGLKQQASALTESIYPVDGQAGGTWFGINNHGVVLALLNRYQDPQHSPAPTRGQIIPQALLLGAPSKVSEHLAEQCYQGYNPFDLVLVANNTSEHFTWNGQLLSRTHIKQAAFQLSSSALNTEQVLAIRKQRFEQWLHSTQTRSAGAVLQDIHLQQCRDNRDHSVLMDREDAHSKSICQVVLSPHTSELNYYPEASLQIWREQLHQANTKPLVTELNKQHHQFSLLNRKFSEEVSS